MPQTPLDPKPTLRLGLIAKVKNYALVTGCSCLPID
jgi:hypothetical protein